MNKEVSAFGNTEIQKRKFHNSEHAASYNAFNTDGTIISKRVHFSKEKVINTLLVIKLMTK